MSVGPLIFAESFHYDIIVFLLPHNTVTLMFYSCTSYHCDILGFLLTHYIVA